jgi:glucose uptake protein
MLSIKLFQLVEWEVLQEQPMYQPEAYGTALLFMVGSMLCWGSWANTMKLTPGWAFQLLYWDYVLGIIVASLFWGLTLGSAGGGPLSFINNIHDADSRHIIFALLGGAVFNVANLLLVAAIEIAGLAVAFPVGIGLALVMGVLLNYFIAPHTKRFRVLSDCYPWRRGRLSGPHRHLLIPL